MSEIFDISLAPSGRQKIDWAGSYMPVLNAVRESFAKERPFEGLRISMSIHMEAKTAYLAQTLAIGGAQVFAAGCNPLSTQDDVAAALSLTDGVEVFARHGVTEEEYTALLEAALENKPHLMIDDGGDFTNLLCGRRRGLCENLIGGAEETTTGIHRLNARFRAGKLYFPMIDVNDADCKHLFDNRYGTGQSTLDAIMHTTNLIIAGKCVVIAGYGWCGRGAAMRAAGMGARVVVTEIDPVKAIEAVMDGFTVMPMEEVAKIGDLFITLTGCRDVIRREHFEVMKDGALLANSGHFDVEIDKVALEEMSTEMSHRRENIVGYRMSDGRILNLLAEGRLVNLAAGNGHPAEIMDMSFGLQALSMEYMAKHGREMEAGVYAVPEELDRRVAKIKLEAMGFGIDALSEAQKAYLEGYGE